MACTSGSVRAVADRTVAAKEQVVKLQNMLKEQDAVHKKTFFDMIDAHLSDAKITDARELIYSSDVKTEYTSEFSLDKIAAVVTSAIEAVGKAQDPAAKSPAMSQEAIDAYTALVNRVAEAAKSTSTSAASLAFSMNRLSPGLFAFLYASSVNIKDVDTFGSEAVTSTGIYYRFIQSIDDVKNEAKFGAAVIDAKNLLDMKKLQAALTDALAAGEIDIDVWTKKDEAYSKAVETIQARLDARHFDRTKPFVVPVAAGFGAPVEHSFAKGSLESQEVVRAAIQRLSGMGEAYKVAIEKSQARLASNYY